MKALMPLAVGAIFWTTTASAALFLNVSFTPTLTSGDDTWGFDGSTWSFTWTFNQATYSDINSNAAIVSDSASLTVSGATNSAYNGTFALADATTGAFLAVPNSVGTLFMGVNTLNNDSQFSFGQPALTVSEVTLSGSSIADPAIGSPVLTSHFDGAMVGDATVKILLGGDEGNYDFGSAQVVAVPEPATYAILVGLGMLAFAVIRRRKSLS